MTNIIDFFTKKPIGHTPFCDAVVKRAKSYAALPARITSNAALNRRMMELQDGGFEIHISGTEVWFSHPLNTEMLNFSEACEYQNLLRKKGGAA